MFSFTFASTWSWPQTSVNRVLMSSGKYTSTPPRDRNQNSAANWMMRKSIANTIWNTNGSACQM